MLLPFKVAAVVVFYHPGLEVVSNIRTYYESIDYLIVIDNSEKDNITVKDEIQDFFPDVIYRTLHQNVGIAAALNIACDIAFDNNCDWILTMDQDSSFAQGQLSQMIKGIPAAINFFKNIGIISPFHVLYDGHIAKASEQYTVKNIVMTSGNLLNLSVYAVTGPFEEKLFMDYTDYEYCLRLRKNKYKIIQDNYVCLEHSLGDFEIKNFFKQKIEVSNHSSLRRYYITRNSLYVGFKYSKSNSFFLFSVLKNIFVRDLLVILFFEKDRLSKLKSMYQGTFDFIFNKFSKKNYY